MATVLAAFGLVFVAELGDKTQLAAMAFAARHRLAPVLGGLVLAYSVTNLLSVAVGGALGASLPTRAIGLGGGVLFLGFAVWALRDEGHDDDGDEMAPSRTRSVLVTVAVSIFVAELGDKTMLAVATLAAQRNPVLTWVGATTGIMASGVVGVLIGRAAGTRLPARAVRVGSAVLFAAFGVALLVTNI